MKPHLVVQLLGGVRISLNEQEISGFRSRTAQALLVYLLMHGRTHSRRRLAEFFWEERSKKQAAANLRAVLSMLNKVLSGVLLIERYTVSLNPDAVIEVDARRFETQLQALLKQPACSAEALSQTMALYGGDFLAGFYLSESLQFQAWEVVERERLQLLAGRGFRRWAIEAMRLGSYEEAAAAAKRLIQADPYDEEGYCLHMEALLRQGRSAAAVRVFKDGKAFLAEELGMEPGQALLAMAEQARAFLWPPPCNAPRPPTPLLGRGPELIRLRQMLVGDTALVTVLAAGGMGKTRLALELAHDIAQTLPGRFLDGVFFVSLAPLDAPELIPNAIAQSLSIFLHDQEVASQQVIDALHTSEALLILDNFDHLITPASLRFLRDIVQHAPDVRVLVTSRRRLGLAEETLFDLRGLAVGNGAGGDAAELFLYHARRVRPNYAPDAEDCRTIARFCRRVEGMPLAIQLAAPWVRHLSPADILARVDQSLDLLAAPQTYQDDPHSSISDVFAASWRQLRDDERQTLARLAVFVGPFSGEAARQIAGATPETLFDLVDKSLLRPAGDTFFDLHLLVRRYALERLDAQEQHADVAALHAAYYRQRLVEAGDALQAARRAGESPQEALAQLRRDFANIRAAWQWLQEHPQALEQAEIIRFVDSFDLFLAFESWYQESIDLYRRAMDIWQPRPVVHGRWLQNLAKAQFGLGLTEEAEATLQPALKLLREPMPMSSSRQRLGVVKMLARQMQRRALPPHHPSPPPQVRTRQQEAIWVYDTLGRIFYYQGNHTAFNYAVLRALTLAEQIDDRAAMARGYANMCIGAAFNHHHNWARYYRDRSRRMSADLADAPARAYVLMVTGVYDGMVGAWEEGERAMQEAQAIYRRLGDLQQWGESFTVGVAMQYVQGKFSQAAAAWGEMARQAKSIGNHLHHSWGLSARAGALLALGKAREAEYLLRQSIDILNRLDSPQNLPATYAHHSLALFQLKNYEAALTQAEAAFGLFGTGTPTFAIVTASFGSLSEVYLGLAALSPEASVTLSRDRATLLARGDAVSRQLLEFSEIVLVNKPRALIYRGLYLWLTERERQARQMWRQAIELAQALAIPYDEGRAHLELALHSDPGAPSHALHASQARRILADLNANYDLSRLAA